MNNRKTPLNLPLTRETLNQNRKLNGQSLIDVIFSIGILVLVLTGVLVLIVSTAKLKTIDSKRSKAVEMSQRLIEQEIKKAKDNPSLFWTFPKLPYSASTGGYNYVINYDCNSDKSKCNGVFTISWGDGESLSVERLFLKTGI